MFIMCAQQNGDFFSTFTKHNGLTFNPKKVLIVLYWTHLFKDNSFNVHHGPVEDDITLYSSQREITVVVRSHSKAQPKIELYIHSILMIQL